MIGDMEQLIHELNQLPDSTRLGLLFGSLLATLVLESIIPDIEFKYRKLRHVATNMVFIVSSGVISLGLAFLAYGVIDITRLEFGLFYIIGVPLWMQLVISLLPINSFFSFFIITSTTNTIVIKFCSGSLIR